MRDYARLRDYATTRLAEPPGRPKAEGGVPPDTDKRRPRVERKARSQRNLGRLRISRTNGTDTEEKADHDG